MNAQKIGALLRRRREQLELSQSQAGDGATPRLMRKTVADIEHGRGQPLLSSFLTLVESLGLCVQIFMAPRRRGRGINQR